MLHCAYKKKLHRLHRLAPQPARLGDLRREILDPRDDPALLGERGQGNGDRQEQIGPDAVLAAGALRKRIALVPEVMRLGLVLGKLP